MLYRYPWDDPSVAPLHPSIGEDKAHWFRELTGYATSADGIRWKKPRLGLGEAPATLRKDGPYTVAATMSKDNNLGAPIDFAYDLQAHGNIADPKKKLLFRVTRKDDTHAFAKVIEQQLAFAEDWPNLTVDPDWKSKLSTIPGGTLSPRGFLTLAGYDDMANVWFQVCQGKVLDWSKREGREIVRYESSDLVHWTGPEVVLPIQPDELKTAKDYVEYMDLDAYRVGGSRTGAWLGQVVIFHSDRSDQQFRMPRPFVVWRKGTTELRLVMSRDAGRTWQRVGGKQVWLPHGEEEHSYDRLVFAQKPLRVGDELWQYYTVYDGDHLVYKFDGSLYYNDGFLRKGRIARATWRWDGYLSVDAGADSGEVVSKPVMFQGNQLRVNLRAPGGELRAELRDAAGKPMRGFTFSDSMPVSGDGLALPVGWRGSAGLSKISGTPVRVAFRLKNAALYSYQFE
jgi:hypothetical protein